METRSFGDGGRKIWSFGIISSFKVAFISDFVRAKMPKDLAIEKLEETIFPDLETP